MEAAATLTWRTHYINLTPMYFNKAEGCYKYTPVLPCAHFSSGNITSFWFLETLLQITNSNSLFTSMNMFSLWRKRCSNLSKDTFANRKSAQSERVWTEREGKLCPCSSMKVAGDLLEVIKSVGFVLFAVIRQEFGFSMYTLDFSPWV